MDGNLTAQVRNNAEEATAISSGVLSHKITVDVRGEIQHLFFFNDTPTTEIHTSVNTLSLHDALPISKALARARRRRRWRLDPRRRLERLVGGHPDPHMRPCHAITVQLPAAGRQHDLGRRFHPWRRHVVAQVWFW